LSPKELEFLRLFASGLAVGQIAESVHRSKQTISGQKASLKRKLGITRDTDLFRYAYDNGLVMGKEDRPGDIQLPDDDTPAGDPPGKSGE
jgi:two-component system capsular synthesis response regulator RcsB